ncbi:TPA: hypothetical protein F7Z80_06565 [Legionella pneumophila]|nr:hypothetical protein AXF35_04500 [Legionella pneumophila subsp. pascullei]HAT6917203.1 hypothetical protein [Legionella pneumophila]HAT6919646.1 hypothetical protein [Legionella pneumophila]HAT6972286.1 hypothetical protein [Legionella pneumophila]HAU3861457.1 hypothetical protein [Legionella pneumophila]
MSIIMITEIETLLKRAGFTYVGNGRGLGEFEKYENHLYHKNIYGSIQQIQLAMDRENDTVRTVFSNNVPVELRDSIYDLMKNPSEKNSLQLNYH